MFSETESMSSFEAFKSPKKNSKVEEWLSDNDKSIGYSEIFSYKSDSCESEYKKTYDKSSSNGDVIQDSDFEIITDLNTNKKTNLNHKESKTKNINLKGSFKNFKKNLNGADNAVTTPDHNRKGKF